MARDGNIAMLSLDDGRINLVGTTMLTQMQHALEEVRQADAVILTGRRKLFSAGLDIPEINAMDRDGRLGFFDLLHDVRADLFGFPRPLVSAAFGSAVGAGASFLCCGDIRLAADDSGKTGFTESRLGFPLPASARVIATSTLTTAQGYAALLHGWVSDKAEACALGYFQRLAPPATLIDQATASAREIGAVSESASMIKLSIRKAGLQEMERDRAESHNQMVDVWETAMHKPQMRDLAASMQRRKS